MSKWEMVRLGDVLEYEQPTKYLVESDTYNSSYKTPVLTAGKTFILGYTNEEKGVFSEIPVIIFDDFTTATKYVDFSFKVKSSAMKILRPTHNIHLKYIFYLMSRIKIDTQLHKRYWISIYSNIHIPLPPFEEQKKIAQELDSIQSLIAKRKEQLEKIDLLVKAKFVEMFGDIRYSKKFKYVAIKDITTVSSGGTPSRENSLYWSGNINWIKTTELKNNLIFESVEKITDDGLRNSSAKVHPVDTILVAMYGQGKTRGMTALLKAESTTNQACACILPSKKYNSYYLWNYIILCYNDLRELAKGGNQPNLNVNMIKNYKVLLPPIDLQNQFADYVQQTETLKTTMHSGLEKLELLYNSKMQEYYG